ncbi:MAG: RNA polymerase sigma factor [Alphaproteobacteria bacterium]|nr:RNA polymerase sigma factor [Alphaproteobacteria bacterium]
MQVDESEIRALYDRYGGVLFHRCRSILGNDEDANDAVQETFARVIRHYEAFRADASPLTWMYRISTNLCLNQVRNRRSRRDKREHHRDDIVGDGFAQHDANRWEDADLVRRLLVGVDDETQRMVVHLYFDDMTRQEVADLMGVSLPTLRKRLNYFLKRSRRRIETHAVPDAALAILAALLPLVL